MGKKKEICQGDRWVEDYADPLYRYALARLRNPDDAENAVQDTFVSALEHPDRFKGQSKELTWLTGILKHKIFDLFRLNKKEQIALNEDDNNFMDAAFDKEGKWKTPPSLWAMEPMEYMEKTEFWDIFEKCLNNLPGHLKKIFVLKELEDIKTEEVCKVFTISPTNLWVRLHRAREKLRCCFLDNWPD